jgi:proteasome accessory factor B
VFRLSRIEGAVSFGGPPGSVVVPAGTDVRELVRDWDSSPPAYRTATLRVRTGAGHGLRRQATAERPDGDGWDEIQASFHDIGWYADYLASFGADVIAVDPPDLREAVIRRLKGVPQ